MSWIEFERELKNVLDNNEILNYRKFLYIEYLVRYFKKANKL